MVLISNFNTFVLCHYQHLKKKGQITLPSSIRREIHAEKGDIFDFRAQEDQVIMTRQRVVPANTTPAQTRKDLSKWIGAKPSVFNTADEVDQFIRNQRDLWS